MTVSLETLPTPALMRQLMRHEGFSPTPYVCPAGACTIGYGTNLDAHPQYLPEAVRPAAQAGRLRGQALCNALRQQNMRWGEDAAAMVLRDEVTAVIGQLHRRCPTFVALLDQGDVVRAEGLVNMAFNMGVNGLLQFRNTLALMDRAMQGNAQWTDVREALRRSLWWRQVGRRARELGEQFVTGHYVGA